MDGIGLGPGWRSRGGPRTRLLVSVASVAEIRPALAGGAHVLDVKDPARGSLGTAAPALVVAARAVAPEEIPVSAALGDALPRGRAAATALALRAGALARAGAEVLKVGLAGAGGPERAREALVELRARLDGVATPAPRLVAVAFADEGEKDAIRPRDLTALAAGVGLEGAMLDTLRKGRSILDLLGEEELSAWVVEVRGAGLLSGLAGSLSLAVLGRAAALGPHVVGVRGAVCRGGRAGRLSRDLVRRAARALVAAPAVQAPAGRASPSWS